MNLIKREVRVKVKVRVQVEKRKWSAKENPIIEKA